MMEFKVEGEIKVDKFFEEVVPSVFKESLSQNPPPADMEGTEFRIQFNITGEGGGVYGIVVKNAKEMEVVRGGIPSPMIEITLNETDWRRALTSKVEGVLTMFFDPRIRTRNRYDALLKTKGVFQLELSVEGEEPFRAKIRFNEGDTPEATLIMKAKDYAALMRREINPTTAFMQGLLRFKGDPGFLMKLQSLIG